LKTRLSARVWYTAAVILLAGSCVPPVSDGGDGGDGGNGGNESSFTIERVSVDGNGTQGNLSSTYPAISADGRYVAFRSAASNLVPGDTNNTSDIFVYDRQTPDTIKRVSVNGSGTQGNNLSAEPAISADGRYVAFESYATNLVADDTNDYTDIFVYDRQIGTIERVSVNGSGIQGDRWSSMNSISADGRYVAFESDATNLVTGDTNDREDIFVYDRQTDTIERVSVDGSGIQGNEGSFNPSISSDGRYVAFESYATNLVTGDTNDREDIFVYDRQTDTIERVSVDGKGTQGNNYSYKPAISADGRYVAFVSGATNLVAGDTNTTSDIFVYDRQTDTIERVSVDGSGIQGNGGSQNPSIGSDGRYVAFESDATNLVAGDTNTISDIFVYDRQTDTIERVSVDGSGTQGNGGSGDPSISSDGRYVAFESDATNLVPGDTNGVSDIFAASLW
jgi:Tol biopolymer transport system component